MRQTTRLFILFASVLFVRTYFVGYAAGTLEEAGVRRRQDAQSGKSTSAAAPATSVIETPAGDEQDEQRKPPVEPEETEQPPVTSEEEHTPRADPLPAARFKTLIMADSTGPAPVGRSGSPLAVIRDLDRDGYAEAYVLSIDESSTEGRSYATLSDFGRMLDTKTRIPTYSIVVYEQEGRGIRRILVIELGSYPVLDEFGARSIHTIEETPLCVYGSFQKQDGVHTKWTIFSSPQEYTSFSLRESAAVSFVVDDIDDDDYQDILLFERVLEEGTGYETLVSWYRWTGSEYLREGTINIVRNLKAFLETAKRMILREDWDAFVKLTLDPNRLREEPYAGMTPYELASVAFGIRKPGETAGTDGTSQQRYGRNPIIAVVLPEFYENPFTRRQGGSYAFHARVKIIYENRKERLLQTEIFMRKNPFGGSQFYFKLP